MLEIWTEKYRPKTIEQIVGQNDFKRLVKPFVEKGDVPHLLLYGPPGTGKTSAALAIVNEVLGEEANGNFMKVNASDDRTVEKMRRLVKDTIRHAPFNGGIKIVFLDEADGLLAPAQELLRSPIEEAKKTRFLLVANDVTSFIPPLTERFFSFEFKSLSTEEIATRLREIKEKEEVELSNEELMEIAADANGSLRVAITELQKKAISADAGISEIVQKYQ